MFSVGFPLGFCCCCVCAFVFVLFAGCMEVAKTCVCHFVKMNLTTHAKFPPSSLGQDWSLIPKLYHCCVGLVLSEGLMMLRTQEKELTELGGVSEWGIHWVLPDQFPAIHSSGAGLKVSGSLKSRIKESGRLAYNLKLSFYLLFPPPQLLSFSLVLSLSGVWDIPKVHLSLNITINFYKPWHWTIK